MKKIIFLIICCVFLFLGCGQPTETLPDTETVTSATPTSPETPSNPPVTTPPETPSNPPETPSTDTPATDEGEGANTAGENTGTENTDNGQGTGENNTGNTGQGETTTELTEPEFERPIVEFADGSVSTCDYDYRFGFNVSNYNAWRDTGDADWSNIRVFYTIDGSEPQVRYGMQTGNINTFQAQRGNNCNFEDRRSFDSVTVKAIACYVHYGANNQRTVYTSDIIEKTYTFNQYNITYVSDLPYSNLPSNRTKKKGLYEFGNIGRYYPDVRGYWFSHFEVNGTRYELNDSFTVNEDITIKYCWKEWTYPWYDESDVPSGYTKITCQPYEYDDINYSNYLAYRVTYNNYIYTFVIEKSSVQKKRANGNDYVYASGSLIKNALGNNGTLGRQLASYGFSYGVEPREPTKAKVYGYSSSSQKVFFTMYTNLNENDYNSMPTEIYVNLSDLRNINF